MKKYAISAAITLIVVLAVLLVPGRQYAYAGIIILFGLPVVLAVMETIGHSRRRSNSLGRH